MLSIAGLPLTVESDDTEAGGDGRVNGMRTIVGALLVFLKLFLFQY